MISYLDIDVMSWCWCIIFSNL